jgi:hypothetical protein
MHPILWSILLFFPILPQHETALGLDAALASRFVKLSLACVDRPFPNKPSHVFHATGDLKPPRHWTPAFFGCFDWHSAVHGHWAMVRVLNRLPHLPQAKRMRQRLSRHLTRKRIQRELAFFKLERSRLFERPYGWGWLLRLAAELHSADDAQMRRWSRAVKPLSDFLARQSISYLDRLSVPVRVGTHQNTAFAMVHMLDYARTVSDQQFERALLDKARAFYLSDRNCPTDYEPSGEDFLSPCLTEADLMRRVLPAAEFAIWLKSFLPKPDDERFQPLASPIQVKDRHDPRIGHLIGLALQRAWCFQGLARHLPAAHPHRPIYRRLARIHLERGLTDMFDSGYGGEHWLASFAIYALTDMEQ